MTTILLAITSSLAYGFTDFIGGMAARRAHVLVIGVIAQPAGVVMLLLLLPWLGGELSQPVVGWAVLAGVSGAGAYYWLFQALAIGPMSIASPLSALVSAVLPVCAGLAFGERLSPGAVVGIALGLVAVLLVSREHEDTPHPVTRRVVVMSLLSGVFIAGFFVALDRTPEGSGLWPLILSRVVCGLVMAAAAARIHVLARPERTVFWLAVASAALDVVATTTFLLATRAGLLAIVAVITALYPAGTMLLARVVLHERLQLVQKAGLALAAGSVVLLALTS